MEANLGFNYSTAPPSGSEMLLSMSPSSSLPFWVKVRISTEKKKKKIMPHKNSFKSTRITLNQIMFLPLGRVELKKTLMNRKFRIIEKIWGCYFKNKILSISPFFFVKAK
jgi:hypothetical protein